VGSYRPNRSFNEVIPMAEFPIQAGYVIEAKVNAYLQSSVIMNVYHYKVDDTFGGTLTGTGVLTNWLDNFLLLLYGAAGPIPNEQSSNLTYTFATAQIVWPNRYYYVLRNMPYTGARAIAPDLPSDVQLCCTLRNDTTGRGKAGRKSFAGFQVDQFTNAFWKATLTTPWGANVIPKLSQDVAATVPLAMNTRPQVWSPRVAGNRQDVIQAILQNQVRVMRRRQVGIGA
jgi:hypothetical protein